MKNTINLYDFTNAFRSLRPDNFSSDGLQALFNYIGDYETDTGEEVELDVIALCCEFTEYADLEDFQRCYSDEYLTIENIEENTIVIRLNNGEGFIVQDF